MILQQRAVIGSRRLEPRTRLPRLAAVVVEAGAPQYHPAAAAAVGPPPQQPLPPDLLLRDLRVVLVAPKHEANIGAVTRCCANFECVDLVVVAPRWVQ